MSPTPSIAFLGPTGGVVNSVLVHALRDGKHVAALVRTPSKLIKQLESQGLTSSMLSSQLTIITGNALDTSSVKSLLTANNTPGHIVSQIVSGLGAAPSFVWNWRNPLACAAIDQPTLCGDAAQTLVTALDELYNANPKLRQRKPKLTFVSTTGISSGPEDVPVGLQTLYHNILAMPHKDKREMERVFCTATVFGGIVGVRPTLLTGAVSVDGGYGWEKIRAGRMQQPVLGWTVNRSDVGEWMWMNVVGDEDKRRDWEGEMISLAN